MTRDFDIIVYGASGFASRYIIKKLLSHNINLALAGRNKKRIEENISEIKEASDLDIFEGDINCNEELDAIISRGTIIVNCAGPYVYSGEQIVESCLRCKTHYIDISGETYFIERCIQMFGKEAESSNIYVINCAGFDSIPADIGVEHLKNILIKEAIGVDETEKIRIESTLFLNNCYINKTTYDSVIQGFALKNETVKLRKKHKQKSNVKKNKIKKLFYSEEYKSYCGIFPGTDASVVKRSQETFVKNNISRACEYLAYVKLGSAIRTSLVIGSGMIFYFMALSRLGRWCLFNFPRVFTLNCIKARRPTDEEVKNGSFEFKLKGCYGNIKKKMIVSGPDPGYSSTAICVTECAILLLEKIKEKEKNPANAEDLLNGGVLTPAVAFHGSDLIERLKLNGINFEITD